MVSLCGVTGPDVVILSDDFAGMERKSYFRVTRSRQEAVLCRAGRPGCLSWCFDMTPDLWRTQCLTVDGQGRLLPFEALTSGCSADAPGVSVFRALRPSTSVRRW
jgi:hypothetical protein